ncbi:uncharacterized protein LOC119453503 [Dermacentor silvarum]|uniref:uncharacterized protein LOC119453503 n=1 Tax=Dermacentor silvarum TaxID=543639 RepID=UPI002101BCFC|nr:uncharacterized protein LOC119453503 [Dermacentor silvarum]
MDEASTSSSASIGARGFGRPRKYANEAEARDARNAARRARRRKAGAALLKAPLSPNSRRAQRSAAMKEKRQNNPDLRRREADLKKQKRSSDPELRRREAELRKRKRKEEASAKRERRRIKLTGANNRLKKAFMDKPFGSVCSVCDRLCFANDLSAAKESACALLGQHFLDDRDVTAVQCCSGMGCTPAVSMGHCGVEMVSKATTTAKLKVDATTQCAVLRIPKSTMASRVKLTSTTGMQTERITEEVGVAAQTELTSVGLQALETQCLALNEALYTARSENEQLQLSKAAFQGCEAKVIFYTGMPNFTQLNSLFEVLESHVSHNVNNSLSKFQEFILFLMKLKLNLHNVDLGFRFGVSEATVCRIFDKWLHCAYCRLKTQIVWPDRTALRRTMPQAFYDAFGDDVSVIIDCFELKIERPSSFLPRSETWSQYKGSNTAKFLIGIAPTGVVTFISEGWGGRTTDRHITEHCGLLDYLLPGDVVLADRGFNISESVGFYCARLHIPAFTRGKKQLSAEEVESTRKLANVRIHVERVLA